MIIIKQNSKE